MMLISMMEAASAASRKYTHSATMGESTEGATTTIDGTHKTTSTQLPRDNHTFSARTYIAN